jgi:hypothetical protein
MARSRKRNRQREANRQGISLTELRARGHNSQGSFSQKTVSLPKQKTDITSSERTGDQFIKGSPFPERIYLSGFPGSLHGVSEEELRKVVVSQVASHYGIPKEVVSDDFILKHPLFDAADLTMLSCSIVNLCVDRTTVGDLLRQLSNPPLRPWLKRQRNSHE